jgi:hypothetical protein
MSGVAELGGTLLDVAVGLPVLAVVLVAVALEIVLEVLILPMLLALLRIEGSVRSVATISASMSSKSASV